MPRSTLLPIFFPLVTILVLLAWIGWRFFYPSRDTAPPAASAPPSRSRLAWPRFRWALPRPSLPPLPRLGRNMLWLAVPLLLVALTVAVTLSFASHHKLPDPAQVVTERERTVRDVLLEEKLLVPTPLPPSTFFGTERSDLEAASRDWNLLKLEFAKPLAMLFERMQKRQYPIALLEGYRSPERQDMLAAKGPHVTNARAWQSKHQYGIAADLAPLRNGRLVISEQDPWAAAAYQALGEEAAALGLTWGGNWAMHDLGHVELPRRPKTP